MLTASKNITLSEICRQPDLWKSVSESVSHDFSRIDDFLKSAPKRADLEVLLTGAGSSAFVGEAVSPLFQKKTGLRCRAVATTDIVTHPEDCIPSDRPILLISYARSGNSPESIAAINWANQRNSQVFHLIITCNAQGALAKLDKQARTCVVLLPEEANDKGLAMIGSVTGMILASLLIADRANGKAAGLLTGALANAGTDLLNRCTPLCRDLANLPFERIVCLGSGPLLGVAREGHLKVQELSDGQVIGKFDSYLGFRHGPKAVVNDRTFLIYLGNPAPDVARYEADLWESVIREMNPLGALLMRPRGSDVKGLHNLALDPENSIADPAYLLPLYLLPIQLLAVFKSQQLGLNPDSPSARGAIHRVVQGVTIYPYQESGSEK